MLLQAEDVEGISDVFVLQPALEALITKDQPMETAILCRVEIFFAFTAAVLMAFDLIKMPRRHGSCRASDYTLLLLGKTIARLSWCSTPLKIICTTSYSKAILGFVSLALSCVVGGLLRQTSSQCACVRSLLVLI